MSHFVQCNIRPLRKITSLNANRPVDPDAQRKRGESNPTSINYFESFRNAISHDKYNIIFEIQFVRIEVSTSILSLPNLDSSNPQNEIRSFPKPRASALNTNSRRTK